ncbi:hypothetical protein [Delftia tsuruhatensis]|uniref:hypothetical protein n=1 Tax=Delftia tsuruhatensis TaxID=180282 RepID=UPI0020906B57|nr:hypothetical protein [Delftia tsuruhatensis]MCO5338279.1 hypothetical protein [Delftia tsuruhatensis]MCR4545677.1 hypothetical protein [Delftia tsuruhatensis]
MTAARITMPSIPLTSSAFAYRDSRCTDIAATIARAQQQRCMVPAVEVDPDQMLVNLPRRRVRAGAPAMPQYPTGVLPCARS